MRFDQGGMLTISTTGPHRVDAWAGLTNHRGKQLCRGQFGFGTLQTNDDFKRVNHLLKTIGSLLRTLHLSFNTLPNKHTRECSMQITLSLFGLRYCHST